MTSNELFKIEPEPTEPKKMDSIEFFEKTKLVLTKIYNSYSQGYMNRVLTDEEYPEESICDKCTGCGLFMDSGEKKECFQHLENGYCYHRFCDYEQVGIDLEANLEDIFDLLSVDEIINL